MSLALTFAEGSRSWLESDYDGAPTEHSAKLIGKAINIGDSPVSDKNVAIALTFAEGSRSWLESDYDGGPTEYAAEKIAEAINGSLPALKVKPYRYLPPQMERAVNTQRSNV
jgi:flavodoxin